LIASRGEGRIVGLLFAALILICMICTLYAAFVLRNVTFAWICAGGSVLVISLFVLLVRILHTQTNRLLAQLSDMIGALIDMREIEVFSVLEDDMLSKLQTQVSKLTFMLRAHNVKLREERDGIRSLVSDIAHQLKTPLANLTLYSGFLCDEGLDSVRRNQFAMDMLSQVEKLSWLIESMVKISRLESGIIQLQAQRVSLKELLLKVVKQGYERAQNKGIDLEFRPSQDIWLTLDLNWTVEAIFNLLDNAVKYTDTGGKVSIATQRYELYARIDIQDTGAGVAEEEIPRLFGRFYRGEAGKEAQGVGIGLYLARKIVTLQNGYIKVNSKLGEGSVFSVFLPFDAVTSE